MSDKQAV